MKRLYADLCYFTPRVKKTKPIPPDSHAIERRLLQEVIDDVVQNSLGNYIDIEQEMQRIGIFAAGEGFENGAQASRHAKASLFRDQPANAIQTPDQRSITLAEVHSTPVDLHTIAGIEPFGDSTLKELGQSGMLEGPMGEKIFHALKQRERQHRESEQNQVHGGNNIQLTPSHDQGREAISNVGTVRDAEALTDFHPEPVLPIEAEGEVTDMNRKELDASQPVGSIANRISRREMFERLAEELEREKQKTPKKIKRRRRRQKRSPSPTRHENDSWKMNRPLIRRKRRPKIPKLRLSKVGMYFIPDTFDDFDDYVEDNPLWQEIENELEAERNAVASPLQMGDQQIESLLHASKRRRIELVEQAHVMEIEEYMPVAQVEPPLAPNVSEQMRDERPRLNVPRNIVSSPRLLSTAKPKTTSLTGDDLELAVLRRSAFPEDRIIDTNKIVENIRSARLRRTEGPQDAPPLAPIVEKRFRYVKGPYQLGTTSFVDFQNDDGTFDRHSKYAMEVTNI